MPKFSEISGRSEIESFSLVKYKIFYTLAGWTGQTKYAIQCSTLTFLDTRHWASEEQKSLAHKGNPLAPPQKKKTNKQTKKTKNQKEVFYHQ